MKQFYIEVIWISLFVVLISLAYNYQKGQYREYNLYANDCMTQGGVIMSVEKNFYKDSYQCYLLPKEEK